MNFEQPKEVTDFESMTANELEHDPVAAEILQRKALEYLKTKDKEWFEREYTGELTPDGFLVPKAEGAVGTKPFQSVSGDGFLWVVEQTKKELLNDPDFVQPRDGKGLEKKEE